jgi:hypothetical protein
LKSYTSLGVDQIPAELIQAGEEALRLEIHKLIKVIWKKELPRKWKESVVVPIHKKGDKTGCSNYYLGVLLLSTLYKILSIILLARLTPYADETIGDHQFGFRNNI